MEPIHVETIVQTDGELHISQLPFHRGDHVEAIISRFMTNPVKKDEKLQKRIA